MGDGMNATWILWAAATLIAVSLLSVAVNRRRATLTDSLRQHVRKTIGPLRGSENTTDQRPADNGGDGS